MRRRIALWALLGFAITSCFVLYTFISPPEDVAVMLHQPAGEVIGFVSFPIGVAFRDVALKFWWVILLNTATYALIGCMVELVRRKFRPHCAL